VEQSLKSVALWDEVKDVMSKRARSSRGDSSNALHRPHVGYET